MEGMQARGCGRGSKDRCTGKDGHECVVAIADSTTRHAAAPSREASTATRQRRFFARALDCCLVVRFLLLVPFAFALGAFFFLVLRRLFCCSFLRK